MILMIGTHVFRLGSGAGSAPWTSLWASWASGPTIGVYPRPTTHVLRTAYNNNSYMHAVPHHTVHNVTRDRDMPLKDHVKSLRGNVKKLSQVLKNEPLLHPSLSVQKVPQVKQPKLHLDELDDATTTGRTEDDPDDGVTYQHFRALRKTPVQAISIVERSLKLLPAAMGKRLTLFMDSLFFRKIQKDTLGEREQKEFREVEFREGEFTESELK